MKQLYIIRDNKKCYYSKSISGYKKKLLLKAFEKSLLESNYYDSLYFGFEIISSGYFKDFWIITITILSEYIHILNPDLPIIVQEKYEYFKDLEKQIKQKKIYVLNMRNLLKFQRDVIYIIKNIVNSKKKHISFFINQSFNNQLTNNRDRMEIIKIFKRFKQLLHTIINNKITYKGNTDILKVEFFNTLGQILAIDCDSIQNLYYPFNINLYHHTNSKKHSEIISIFWNIVLKSSKINNNIMTPIISIYKLYNKKILHKLEKESFQILHVIFYFIYKLEEIPILNVIRQDFIVIQKFYENIQSSLANNIERIDFIDIEDKNKEKNKKIKKNKKSIMKKVKENNKNIIQNLTKKNIILANKEISYIPIEKIIEEEKKSFIKPIQPSQIIEKVENEKKSEEKDDLMIDMIKTTKKKTEKSVIDIIINKELSKKEQRKQLSDNILFNFDDLPINTNINNNNNKEEECYNDEKKNIIFNFDQKNYLKNFFNDINKT